MNPLEQTLSEVLTEAWLTLEIERFGGAWQVRLRDDLAGACYTNADPSLDKAVNTVVEAYKTEQAS